MDMVMDTDISSVIAMVPVTRVYESSTGNAKFLHRDMKALDDLLSPSIIETPYQEDVTATFLSALLRLGLISLPEGCDIVLLRQGGDPEILEKLLFSGSKVLLDLSSMDGVAALFEEPAGLLIAPSWVGDVPHLDEYVASNVRGEIRSMLLAEWNCSTFDERDEDGEDIELGLSDIGNLLSALGMGKVDMEDVLELFQQEISLPLDAYQHLRLRIEEPDWAASIKQKVADVLGLWHYQASRESVRIALRDGSLAPDAIEERIHRVGELLGMDVLLATYASGVPADDITA